LVFMAEQQRPVRRMVALKVLKPGMDTRHVIARFEAERQALALMDHSNIARVFDGGETPSGRPYFVMELVRGIPITDFCDQNQLTIRERLGLILNVCQAVQHAHQKGIIHRDIKPSNVLVTLHDGAPVVKVIDFGIAKATGQQLTDKTLFTNFAQLIGTPLYMSPEQAALSGLDVDTRSDIYSLGVLLYELLTGTTPFDQARFREAGYDEIRRIIREEEPPKPSTRISTLGEAATTYSTLRKSDPKRLTQLFRGELDWIVMKCLEKDRNRRYDTANTLTRDIEHYLHDEPVRACPPSAWYRLGKFSRRNRTALAIAGLVLLVLLLLGSGAGWFVRDRAVRQAELAGKTRESLGRARSLISEKKLPLAREELAKAKGRLGDERTRLVPWAQEVDAVERELEAVEASLRKYQRFLGLIDQAHQAEFPRPAEPLLQAGATHGTAAPLRQIWMGRDPAKAVPILLEALSCYGVLEHDDWSARLEAGLLDADQVARVRRTAYEELLWLADDLGRRAVPHRSGRELSARESAQEALAYLREAEAAFRPTSAFYRIRAACRKTLGEDGEAREDDELVRQTPGLIALDHYLLAVAAYAARNKAEALRQCEAALRVEPTHYWSLLWLGASLCDLGQQEQDSLAAAAAFTGCIMKRPEHAYAYYCRGNAYLNLSHNAEAVADCSKAIELDPKEERAFNSRGTAYYRLGHPDKALDDFSEAIKLDPKDAYAWSNRGVVYTRLNQPGKALPAFSRAIELDPKLAQAWNGRGQAYHALRQPDKAVADFRAALRLLPDHEAYHNLGDALLEQGKPADAEAAYRQAIHIKSDCAQAHYNLGIALENQGKPTEAVTAYREAIHLHDDYPEAHSNLGVALYQQRNYAEAEAEFRTALRLRPDFPEAYNAYHNLGNALRAQAKHAEAEQAYRRALGLLPAFLNARLGLGNALDDQGKHAEAEAEFREAIRLRPEDPGGHNNLASALAAQGKLREAEAEMRETIRLRPGDAVAHENLGQILLEQGRFADALAAFRRSHKLGSRQPDRQVASAKWIRQAEQLVALDAKLGKILRGDTQPADAAERLELAKLCQEYKKFYAAAVRLFAQAFAAEPKLADDLGQSQRYNAACAAALAGCGQGGDAATLDEKERTRLRRQALDWLRADLNARSQLLEKKPDEAAAVQKTLQQWLQDADIAALRAPEALSRLPDAERQPWQRLWQDVQALQKRAAQTSLGAAPR